MDIAKGYSIAWKGLKSGSHTFDFKVDQALFECFGNEEIKRAACAVHLDLQRSETMLELAVTITGEVTTLCDRCLEECTLPIQFEGTLVVKFSDQEVDYDGEVLYVSPSADSVDLAQYIYESMVLSLPYQRVHPEGQCDPEMLERFRIVSKEEFDALEAKKQTEEELSVPAEMRAQLAQLKQTLEQQSKEKK
ncbi:MAG: DUF177 domain-containing protein [Alistipes sp.]